MTTELVITGLGLHLREWLDDDLPAMVKLFDDPDVSRWTPLRSPFDDEAARAYLERARAGRGLQLAITTDGHTPLGEVLLMVTDGEAELAYAVGAVHRGQGLAPRAVRLMTAYAYNTLAVQHIVLRIDPANAASESVARATGFHLTDAAPITRDAARNLLTWRHA